MTFFGEPSLQQFRHALLIFNYQNLHLPQPAYRIPMGKRFLPACDILPTFAPALSSRQRGR
jgi:hypothetical protein